MSYEHLQDKIRDWSICLTVSGLDILYFDKVAPPPTLIDQAGALSYRMAPGLGDVGNLTDEYRVEGGLATHGAITVTLDSKGRFARSDLDPGVVFGRITSKSSSWSGVVLESLDRGALTSIEISEDPSGLTFPRLFHIDSETIYATGYASSPWRLTGITRGVARTTVQNHTVNLDTADVPEITTEVVHWRTRWVTVHAAPIFAPGVTGGWVELFHGFIDFSPEMSPGGTEITITIAPLTAIFDTELETPLGINTSTRLLQGFHHYAYPNGCFFEHVQRVRYSELMFNADAPGISGRIYYNHAGSENWERLIDPTRIWSRGHPRLGALTYTQGRSVYEVIGWGTDGTGNYYSAPAAPITSDGAWWISAERRELFRHITTLQEDGAEETLRWPYDVFDSINGADGWTPLTTVAGQKGSWKRVLFTPSAMVIIDNTDTFSVLEVLWRNGGGAFAFFSEGDPPRYWHGDAAQVSRESSKDLSVWYPIKINGDESTPGSIRHFSQTQRITVPMDVASAYYQRGEYYILVEDDIKVPWGGAVPVEISLDGKQIGIVDIFSSTPVSYGGDIVGYKLTIDPEDVGSLPSFGDWEGQSRIDVRAVTRIRYKRSAEILLELITSGGGDGPTGNGNYDLWPVGLNLPSSSAIPSYSGPWGPFRPVDEDTFLALAGPPVAESWKLSLTAGVNVRDQVDQICRATATVIVLQRTPAGRCILRRISVSREGAFEAIGAIQAGEFMASSTPANLTDDRVVGVHKYLLNHGEDGEPKTPITITDSRALRTYQEAEEYELDLRGAHLSTEGDAVQILRPLYSRARSLLGWERRVWAGEIPTYLAMQLQIGGVYLISSEFLKGYGDLLGVSGAAARLVFLQVSLNSEDSRARFVFYDANSTGWNAACLVRFVLDPTNVLVDENQYTSVRNQHAQTVQTDVEFFSIGDVVRIVPPGNHDSAQIRTITNISGPIITFDGPHNLTSGGYIEPPVYDSQSGVHKGLASIADGNGFLGAANVRAFEIS